MDNTHFIKRCAIAGMYWDEDLIARLCDSLEEFRYFCKELISYTSLRDIELQDSYTLIPYFYYYYILSIPEYRRNQRENQCILTPEEELRYNVETLFHSIIGFYDSWNYISLNINYVLFPDKYFDNLFANSKFPDGTLICKHKTEILKFKKKFINFLQPYFQKDQYNLNFIKDHQAPFDKNHSLELKQNEKMCDALIQEDLIKKQKVTEIQNKNWTKFVIQENTINKINNIL